ncbi:MAG: response regulator [Oscillospiraceae bacterium]|jgi:signal transduction histidine kinase/CheY-like chemotaxis protein/HAMP domain-containing protein|nr:response regulator [Oscillospiraceae bacterium]
MDRNPEVQNGRPDVKRAGLGMRTKLMLIFLAVKIIPLVITVLIAYNQITALGTNLRDIAVRDSEVSLNSLAVENIERMSTDTAQRVAEFLYGRDDDIRYLSGLAETFGGDMGELERAYAAFVGAKTKRVVKTGEWRLDGEENAWVPVSERDMSDTIGSSTNAQNETEQYGSTFNPREASPLEYVDSPLYDEVTFIGLDGVERIRISTTDSENSRKKIYAGWFKTGELRDIKDRYNTFVRAEDYWNALPSLTAERGGDIYVSDVIGAYTGSNFIGAYTPENVAAAAETRGYDIEYAPEEQSYAGEENPNGVRFEGIVRWASPVYADGEKIGYVTLALDHDHIMEFVDHQTPMNERYTELPSAAAGNYAFIWDYQCRSIAHPRHNSIVGFDPETGYPQIPWISQTIYEKLLAKCGVDSARYQELTPEARFGALKENWSALIARSETGDPVYDMIIGQPTFENQARADTTDGPDPDHTPAADLTKLGMVGLDGRYLNNAPQCIGWLDLTRGGGSGSLYILWSGWWKLNTAAAIPYYTGRYAPSAENGNLRVGFGFVAIGSSIEDFTQPAQTTNAELTAATRENLTSTVTQLVITTAVMVLLLVLVAIWMSSYLTNRIRVVIDGISRFRSGERQFRFNSDKSDEFGMLADSFDEMADSVVDSVTGPLVITDMALNIVYINEPGLALGGLNLDSVAGESYFDHGIYPNDSAYCPITALREGREAEVFYHEPTGRYYKGSANFLLDRIGVRIGYIIVSTDVTELSVKQLELEHAVETANRASEYKGEFLARMSHEIRTPMNAIIGITSIVRRRLGALSIGASELGEIRENVAQIETSSQHLLGLLNDILDLSKIEAGKIDITEEIVDLSKLAEMVESIIRPRCAEKEIKFESRFGGITHSSFLSDSLRLRQVLINLLGNAVKFTPEHGHVYFGINCIDRRDGKSLIEFVVRDTGIGISPENIEAIFKPFEQGGGGVTKRYGGTGLGLSISRRIVQLLGDDIRVDSEPGRGSEFRFELWMTETESVEDAVAGAEDLTGKFAGRKLLLVDDVEINRMIVATMIEDTGAEIIEADDGVAAVDAFMKSAVGEIDVILMDVQMPTMDGYEAAGAIRALRRPDAETVPIIALTANAFKEDIDKAVRSGMNSHIAKPVEIETLLGELRKYLKR